MKVEIKNKSYDGKRIILKDINLDFPKGKSTLIIGTSGAGKSTLIKCLINQTSYKGSITDGSRNKKKMLPKIAYIPQHPALNRRETVEQSIFWTARWNSLFESRDTLEERADECIKIVGLDHVRSSVVSNLSGGQMQRVAIAKELIREKEIIIADEIDTGLDCGVARYLCNTLRKLAHERNKTVIVISHNLTNIELYDQVVVLVKDGNGTGRIAYAGSPTHMKQFFEVDDYVDILLKLNSKAEGGDGVADKYIEEYKKHQEEFCR